MIEVNKMKKLWCSDSATQKQCSVTLNIHMEYTSKSSVSLGQTILGDRTESFLLHVAFNSQGWTELYTIQPSKVQLYTCKQQQKELPNS